MPLCARLHGLCSCTAAGSGRVGRTVDLRMNDGGESHWSWRATLQRVRIAVGLLFVVLGVIALAAVSGAENRGDVWLSIVGFLVFGLTGFALAFRKASARAPFAGIVLVVLGGGLSLASLDAWNSERAFAASAVQTDAVLIVDTTESCSSAADRPDICNWYTRVAYTVEGVRYEGSGAVSGPGLEGDVVTISYLPQDPSVYRTGGTTRLGSVEVGDVWLYWAGMILGVLMVGWGGWVGWEKIRYGNPPRDQTPRSIQGRLP